MKFSDILNIILIILFSPIWLVLAPLFFLFKYIKQKNIKKQKQQEQQKQQEILDNADSQVKEIQVIQEQQDKQQINALGDFFKGCLNTFDAEGVDAMSVKYKILQNISALILKYSKTNDGNDQIAQQQIVVSKFLEALKEVKIAKKDKTTASLYELFVNLFENNKFDLKKITQSQLLVCYKTVYQVLAQHLQDNNVNIDALNKDFNDDLGSIDKSNAQNKNYQYRYNLISYLTDKNKYRNLLMTNPIQKQQDKSMNDVNQNIRFDRESIGEGTFSNVFSGHNLSNRDDKMVLLERKPDVVALFKKELKLRKKYLKEKKHFLAKYKEEIFDDCIDKKAAENEYQKIKDQIEKDEKSLKKFEHKLNEGLSDKEREKINQLRENKTIDNGAVLNLINERCGPSGDVFEVQEHAGSNVKQFFRTPENRKYLSDIVLKLLPIVIEIHKLGYYHGDLKCDNICIQNSNNQSSVKIIDNIDSLIRNACYNQGSCVFRDNKEFLSFSNPDEAKFSDLFAILFLFIIYNRTTESQIICLHLMNAFCELKIDESDSSKLTFTRKDNGKDRGDDLYNDTINSLYYLALEQDQDKNKCAVNFINKNMEEVFDLKIVFHNKEINSIDDVESKFQEISKKGLELRNKELQK